ncbi:hypothetical protein NLJ89_g5859 [Agrocybe chaxingu]|uniref:Cytochrome P450 monooxygenase n=1 Tax=Agrocybe chaxingu TaxID=84603 RepID=A0A9W8K0F8_9AGAR|nr:hypothetical protein NLJ89_g5859 [Agrocybe chaxingu]
MLLYPEAQGKAQRALDSVLHGRFPNFGDYGKIPYIDALVHESLRWNPIAPLGLFHALKEDDEYMGYILPKGSICVGNVWAMFRDEDRYGTQVDEFIPERFLKDDGTIDQNRANTSGAFGFGRRACAGESIVRDFAWIVFASILTAYEIVDGTDMGGQPLDQSKIEFSNDFISSPPYIKCRFRLRPGVSESMIYNAAEEAKL